MISRHGTANQESDSVCYVSYWHIPRGSDYVNARCEKRYFSDMEEGFYVSLKYGSSPESAHLVPMVNVPRIDLEKHEYVSFLNQWNNNGYAGQRFGQAFYNHFKLHKLPDQEMLMNLYDVENEHARAIIAFRFNFRASPFN